MWISVIGSIGVGKKRISDQIAQKEGATYFEDFVYDELQDKFVKEPQTYAMDWQVYILTEKFKQQIDMSKRSRTATVVTSRLLEDIKIFSKMLRHFELMSNRDYQIIREIYYSYQEALEPPSIVILLKADIMSTWYMKELTENVCAFTDNTYIKWLNDEYEALAERIAVPMVEVDMSENFDQNWKIIEAGIASVRTTGLTQETLWTKKLLR